MNGYAVHYGEYKGKFVCLFVIWVEPVQMEFMSIMQFYLKFYWNQRLFLSLFLANCPVFVSTSWRVKQKRVQFWMEFICWSINWICMPFNIMTLTKTIRKINKQIKHRLNLQHKGKKQKCAANNKNCTDFHWLCCDWALQMVLSGEVFHQCDTVVLNCALVWTTVIIFWIDMMLSSFKTEHFIERNPILCVSSQFPSLSPKCIATMPWNDRVLKWIFNYYHVGTPNRLKWSGYLSPLLSCAASLSLPTFTTISWNYENLWVKTLWKSHLSVEYICDNTQLTGKHARIHYNPTQSNALTGHVETKSHEKQIARVFFSIHSSW